MKIAIAQVNLCVGAIDANTKTIISSIEKATQNNVDLVIFPELTITSYPPEDLLLRQALHQQNEKSIEKIKAAA